MTGSPLHCFTLALIASAAPTGRAEPSAAEKELARYARGVLAELEDETREARGHYEATLAADPDSFAVARKTADIQLADDDLPAASKTLRTFAGAQAGHLDAQIYYADFLERHAPRDAVARQAATEVLEGANQRFPHTPAVYTRLINLHENRGERDKSLAVFNAQFEAEGAGPDHWMALGPIARTLLPDDSPGLRKRLDLIAGKTVQTGVGIELAARTVSDYYRRTGRLEEAMTVLKQHLGIQPDSLQLRTRL
nr:hypothetical protein [Akkermansiaceae bacterium]